MEIRINGRRFKLYNEVNVNLKYDSIADTFGFKVYFNPNNKYDRAAFKPGTYQTCTIWHENVLILTGTILYHKFSSAGNPPKTLLEVQGYSTTGVLADCPVINSPLQRTNIKLVDYAKSVCEPYGIGVVVDKEVKDICDTKFNNICPEPDEPVITYLDKLAKHLNVTISHTKNGKLLFTKAKTGKLLTTQETFVQVNPVPITSQIAGAPQSVKPTTVTKPKNRAILHDFTEPGDWLHMSLTFDGQKIHTDVIVIGHQTKDNDNAIQTDPLFNNLIDTTADAEHRAIGNTIRQIYAQRPYLLKSKIAFERGKRPRTYKQPSDTGTDEDKAAPLTARGVIGDELTNVTLTIEIKGWTLGGHLVTPNQLITVKNPECYLFNKSTWFIQEVSLLGDEAEETAVLTCVPPESFNEDKIKRLF